jgi:hypothetical protein
MKGSMEAQNKFFNVLVSFHDNFRALSSIPITIMVVAQCHPFNFHGQGEKYAPYKFSSHFAVHLACSMENVTLSNNPVANHIGPFSQISILLALAFI